MAVFTASPIAIAREAFEKLFEVSPEVESTMKDVVNMATRDNRITDLETSVKALKTIIRALIAQCPHQGFENWRPPTKNGHNYGPRWPVVYQEVEDYWKAHNGLSQQ